MYVYTITNTVVKNSQKKCYLEYFFEKSTWKAVEINKIKQLP